MEDGVGGSGIGIILGRHRGIGYRENEDRELEGYTQGREGRGGRGGSCIAEGYTQRQKQPGTRRRKRGSFMVAFVDSKERETPAELDLLSPSPPLPFSGPPPPPLLAHPV